MMDMISKKHFTELTGTNGLNGREVSSLNLYARVSVQPGESIHTRRCSGNKSSTLRRLGLHSPVDYIDQQTRDSGKRYQKRIAGFVLYFVHGELEGPANSLAYLTSHACRALYSGMSETFAWWQARTRYMWHLRRDILSREMKAKISCCRPGALLAQVLNATSRMKTLHRRSAVVISTVLQGCQQNMGCCFIVLDRFRVDDQHNVQSLQSPITFLALLHTSVNCCHHSGKQHSLQVLGDAAPRQN